MLSKNDRVCILKPQDEVEANGGWVSEIIEKQSVEPIYVVRLDDNEQGDYTASQLQLACKFCFAPLVGDFYCCDCNHYQKDDSCDCEGCKLLKG